MEKNKKIQTLSKKGEFDLLKKQASFFSYKWLKIFFYQNKEKDLRLAWGLSKKCVPNSVTRNRLKRWGRDYLKKTDLEGLALVVFSDVGKSFYKELKRKDFDDVFGQLLEKVQAKT